MKSEVQRLRENIASEKAEGPTIVISVKASDANESLGRVKEVLQHIANVATNGAWPNDEEWNQRLPSWFTAPFQGTTVDEVLANENLWDYGSWLDATPPAPSAEIDDILSDAADAKQEIVDLKLQLLLDAEALRQDLEALRDEVAEVIDEARATTEAQHDEAGENASLALADLRSNEDDFYFVRRMKAVDADAKGKARAFAHSVKHFGLVHMFNRVGNAPRADLGLNRY